MSAASATTAHATAACAAVRVRTAARHGLFRGTSGGMRRSRGRPTRRGDSISTPPTRAVSSTDVTVPAVESSVKMVDIETMVGAVFPSNLRCALRVNVPVVESADAVAAGRSLSTYMRLPVDQYVGIDLPMGAAMRRVQDDKDLFQLEIPGLKFLSLEVKPVVRVRVRLVKDGETVSTWTGQSGFPGGKTPEWRQDELARIDKKNKELAELKNVCEDEDVTQTPEECDALDGVEDGSKDDDDAIVITKPVSEIPKPTPTGRPEREDVVLQGPCVLIEAVSCRLEGKVVEELGVNDLFVFRGTTCFRWNSAGDSTMAAELRRTGPGGEDESSSGHANAKIVGKVKPGQACISGWADIGVGVDPPGPFALLPRSVAEKVGDAVMYVSGLSRIQTLFDATYGVQSANLTTTISAPEYRTVCPLYINRPSRDSKIDTFLLQSQAHHLEGVTKRVPQRVGGGLQEVGQRRKLSRR